jgi:SAM-dependent methyltransferase
LEKAGLTNFTLSNISGESAIDVENLPYPDSAFDTVIVHSGLHHCASPHRGLLEMYRVAKKSIILFEPADNLVTRFGSKVGLGQVYEFAAVTDNDFKCGGWRNSAIPNWVYRFNAREIRQAINCNSPLGPHVFRFYYRTRVPWQQLRLRKNKLPLLAATLALPFLRLLDFFGPFTSNNLAAVITKPDLPSQAFPWLVFQSGNWTLSKHWFDKRR